MAVPSCDWQISCTKVKERGKHLLESGQWSDCKFLVGSEPNQLVIQGHKLFLAMASPVFEAMFYGGMAEKNDPIPILDVQPEAFKALLEYIYTDNININSFDKACELCYGAKKYMLPHLVEECTKYLWSDLSPRNACRAFEFARLFEEPVLMDRSLQIICTNTKEVLAESSFEDIELNTIIAIFSQDYLNVDSELDLFEAAVRYAKAKASEGCVTSPSDVENIVMSPSSSADTKPKPSGCSSSSNLVHSLPDEEMSKSQQKISQENKELPSIQSAIKKIRFLSLSPQQFAEGPARSPLLSQAESFAVLMNILSSAPDVPMPEGFSTSTQRRKLIINNTNNVTSFTVDTPSPVMPDQMICSNSNGPSNEPLSLPPHPSLSQPPHPSLSQPPHPSLSQPPVAMFPSGSTAPLPTERDVRDFSKIYCQRTLIQHTDCLNTSVLDCSVTFTVDKNICVIGVQVPTQVLSEESAVAGFVGGGAPSAPGYSELLYAHLLDADGARLTYTHYTSRVPYLSLLDITFNRPVYIQRNKVYKVGIVFNKVGWYPMGTCCQHVAVDSVFFNFGVGQSSDSVRDGLIRSIIFTY